MIRLLMATTALLPTQAARAEPIPDVAPWLREFQAAAVANDPKAMLAEVKKIVVHGFPVEALEGIFSKIDGVVGTEPGDHVEQFNEQTVGTFLKRVNIAVHYPRTYLFYTITFVHDSAGWQMTQVDYNTNINETLTLKWPE